MRDGYNIEWDDKKVEHWSVEDVVAAVVTNTREEEDTDGGRGRCSMILCMYLLVRWTSRNQMGNGR